MLALLLATIPSGAVDPGQQIKILIVLTLAK